MNMKFDRLTAAVAVYGLAAAAIVASLSRGSAQEELPTPTTTRIHQTLIADHPIGPMDPATAKLVERATRVLTAEFGNGLTFRVTMPFPGSMLPVNCNEPTCCEQMLEQITVCPTQHIAAEEACTGQFHLYAGDSGRTIVLNRLLIQPGDVIDTREVRNVERRIKASQLFVGPAVDAEACGTAKFVQLGCPAACEGESNCASKTSCPGECVASACTAAGCSATTSVSATNAGCKCGVCKCEKCQCTSCTAETCKCSSNRAVGYEAKCGEEADCGEDASAVAAFLALHATQEEADLRDPLKLMRHIAHLMAGKAAAEAELEARKEANERLSEMYELMAELVADNAALDAKLQAHADQQKLLEKVGELAAENAKLKAHVELAAERAELQQASLSLTLENERLKFRLAELENKQAAADAARTATKPRPEPSIR